MPTDHAATIYKLICRGLDRDTILEYAVQHAWAETSAEVDKLIEAACEDLAKHAAEVDLDVEFAVAMVRLNRLFMDTSKVQDHKTALAVQKEINKLLELKVRAKSIGAGRSAPAQTNNERPRLSIAK